MENRIPGWLYHCHEVCCEKDSHCERWALIVDKEYTAEMYFLDKWTWHITCYILLPLLVCNLFTR